MQNASESYLHFASLGMSLRPLLVGCLWSALVVGILAIPAAVITSSEDGPMPAPQIWRKQALAKRLLFGGGGLSALAACGLYAISRADRRGATTSGDNED
jgi:hypothetical protein